MANQLQLAFVNFKKDSYIIVEGKQNADRFFIIRQGKVRISKEVEVVEEEGGNILGPGDFFGVVATMSGHSHIETAQAITDVTLISVQRDQYVQLIQNNTPVAMKIILQFSRRMRYLDEALTRLTLKNTAEGDSSQLFKVAEYYAKQSQYNLAYFAYYQYLKYCPQGQHVAVARERITKIAPYARPAYLDKKSGDFTRLYPKDTMIFAEGQPGDELYIIQKGAVKIVKIVDNNEVLLAVLRQGDIFGEMALLESKPRSASAIAYDDCTVLVVNRENFERMVGTQPQIISKLTQLLAERIWFIYKQLANTLISDPLGRMYDALLIQLEKNRAPMGTGSYTFDFGPKELINMVGLPLSEGNLVIHKLLENPKIRVVDAKIHVVDVSEIVKQTEYYRKMQKIERARREAAGRTLV
ncbi:MAG: cyclic nucleotide-binding domain-containing protein [Treponemataceae bacterium]|uniref:Crp/Fnr family transcriptional regulator n=1 Tax=Treponema sp. J25 TaxID=2094121 RepID=UPI00105139AF|nr:cyclic nucleotide-binding domain-containing protein [Treponema sp. J25]MCX7948843.1 cyclic nucleotide-binding domain-containing protein [Treponemataceae bacterium]TCW61539.1 cAMP-binding protein [Treponema sp. J25]